MSLNNSVDSNTMLIIGSALLFGFIISICYWITNKASKNMVLTLGILPMLVVIVLNVVNGNLGAAIGIAGVFSLVRFRSIAGSSKDIISIFASMSVGAVLSTGNILFSAVDTGIICAIFVLFKLFDRKVEKILKITIPENLNYDNLFDDELKKYLKSYSLEKVKTTNMGSAFEITYKIKVRDQSLEKEFVDQLRTKNGNLPISIYRKQENEIL